MDTNLLNILKLLSEQKAVAPPGQGLAIWGIIIPALLPTLAAIAVWFKAKAVEIHAKAAETHAKSADEKAAVAVANTEQTKKETKVLGDHINSRMDQLIEEKGKSSFAAGQTTERASASAMIPPIPVTLTPSTEVDELKKQLESALKDIGILKASSTKTG